MSEPKLLPDVEIPSGWEVIESPGVGVAFRRAGSGYRHITLEVMRDLAATVGLALVPAADVPTPEERAVLEACKALDLSEAKLDEDGLTAGEVETIVDAELARRAAKEAKGG